MLIRSTRAMFLILVLSLMSAQPSHACSCDYIGKFTEYSQRATVIRGTIQSYGPKLSHGKTLYKTMKVSIDELIKGAYPHETIEFTGDPGDLCLTYVDSAIYQISSEHLFAVFNENKEQDLGGCGEVSVSIIDSKVKGHEIVNEKWIEYSIDYDAFIKTVKQ